jgi:DNA-binding MarR family transcriptional regulator
VDALTVEATIAQLTALHRQTLAVLLERRRQRPAGDPTRLQEFALLAIRDRGAMQVSELASLLEIAPATTSQLVTTMEDKGWVRRALLPADRRRHEVTLTAAGREVVAQLEARHRERLARVLAELTPEERAQLVAIARRLAAILARSPEPDHGLA